MGIFSKVDKVHGNRNSTCDWCGKSLKDVKAYYNYATGVFSSKYFCSEKCVKAYEKSK
jgi:hypothetical protein